MAPSIQNLHLLEKQFVVNIHRLFMRKINNALIIPADFRYPRHSNLGPFEACTEKEKAMRKIR